MPAPPRNEKRQLLLAQALHLARKLTQTDSDSVEQNLLYRWQEQLRQLQHELKQFAHPICRETLDIQSIPESVRIAFVQAAVLVTRYAQSGGMGWKGTLHSPTLAKYRTEPVPMLLQAPESIAHLCHGFALDASVVDEVVALLTTADEFLTQQRSLVAAMLADADLLIQDSSPSPIPHVSEERQQSALALFQTLFGPIPLPAEAIDYVYTDTQLYFCIDYTGDRLTDDSLWQQLSAPARTQVQPFLSGLGRFSFESFRRFPTFGACHPKDIDAAWCDRLSQQTEIPIPTLRHLVSRAVGIIPTPKAEAFLLHDIWGHNWQLVLTPFESDYAILADCDEPLRAGETAYTVDGPLTCGELLRVNLDGSVDVDEERSLLFFHGEVRQRLGVLFTHLIGEMVADIAEFKFVWDHPHAAHELLSSSLFKDEPTKLDLGLMDVDFLFLRVLQPLLDIHLSVAEESQLEQDLLKQWQGAGYPIHSPSFRIQLKRAIARLYDRFLEEYSRTYLPTLDGDTGLFTHIVSNLLYLQNVINEIYGYVEQPSNQPDLPFRDLLILFISRFCSADSYAEFWDVDDAIASYFIPCWHQLKDLIGM